MNSLEKCGYLDDELLDSIPGVVADRFLEKKAIAVLECAQQIPCNPCEPACPQGAIYVGRPITNLPQIDAEKCSGCGICVAACPGLAIFLVEKNYSIEAAAITIPYELLPLPEKGQEVIACNRQGIPLCRAVIVKVQATKSFNRTTLVTMKLPKDYVMEARSFFWEEPEPLYINDLQETTESIEEDVMICRCQEVMKKDILAAIRGGCHTINEIKRATRVGMGLCQGRTCNRIVMQILAQAIGVGISELKPPSYRPPVRAIPLDVFGAAELNG